MSEKTKQEKELSKKLFLKQKLLLGNNFQEKIENITVGIIGLGGLGSAISHYLVRLGIKNFILIDDDIISYSNLNRQHLFDLEDVGKSKITVIKEKILKINPTIKADLINKKISSIEDLEILQKADIIFDGLDNHKTRRLLDSFCKNNNKIWIHGAAIKDEGTAFLFDESTKYSDIYSEKARNSPCDQDGVIITTTSIIAALQVQLFINYLLKKDHKKKLLRIKLLNLEINKFIKK